ncbi:MAG: 2-oxoacid:acceptor oxidoreductase subunit alpha [Candidatus Bathyarchaeota archaeon]|nr:2-oxoacid:acceptor oxidoreductase subunit alpha [Candidatus Bathyarchaeota archaeon]
MPIRNEKRCHKVSSKTFFWQGNEACVEAAIVAGCRFFAGYPISPANEISEYMAVRLPKVGGIFMQMEDEIASIGAVMGASWCGVKAMTATSGPGFSLMQETIGWGFMTETPCVVVDVQRVGPGTGQATKAAQGDVMQARWGTHGDYSAIVLSPNSVQEMFELTIRAFNLAEKYRTPVMVLTDEIIAHLREQVAIPPLEKIEIINRRKPNAEDKIFFGLENVAPMPSVGEGFNVAVTASTHDEYGVRFTADPKVHRRMLEAINNKIKKNVNEIAEVETHNVDNCKVGIVSFGCTSRAVYEAVEAAEAKRIKTGHVRLKTIWPFPEKQIRLLAESAERIIVPEMNLGQLYYEVKRVACSSEVVPLNRIGGGEMITPEEILAEILKGE